MSFVATEGTPLLAGQGVALPLDDSVKRDRKDMVRYFSDVHPSLVGSNVPTEERAPCGE